MKALLKLFIFLAIVPAYGIVILQEGTYVYESDFNSDSRLYKGIAEELTKNRQLFADIVNNKTKSEYFNTEEALMNLVQIYYYKLGQYLKELDQHVNYFRMTRFFDSLGATIFKDISLIDKLCNGSKCTTFIQAFYYFYLGKTASKFSTPSDLLEKYDIVIRSDLDLPIIAESKYEYSKCIQVIHRSDLDKKIDYLKRCIEHTKDLKLRAAAYKELDYVYFKYHNPDNDEYKEVIKDNKEAVLIYKRLLLDSDALKVKSEYAEVLYDLAEIYQIGGDGVKKRLQKASDLFNEVISDPNATDNLKAKARYQLIQIAPALKKLQ